MSRIGKKPIAISSQVQVDLKGSTLTVSGPKGKLTETFRSEVKISNENGCIAVEMVEKTDKAKAFWGLTRTLIANMVTGVTEGYNAALEIVGVGFKAAVDQDQIILSLGYSHDIVYLLPEGVTAVCPVPTKIVLSSHDKQLLGAVKAEIRKLRKPEPYKGKGVRCAEEIVRRKDGKKK